MRKETVEYKIYKFEELSEEIQAKVLQDNYDINVDYGWWECFYDEIEELGGECQGFDIDRGSYCKINIDNPESFANEIIKNHGEKCETYKTSENFLSELKPLRLIDSKELTHEQEHRIERLEERFKRDIEYDYLTILRKGYEHLTSEECIKETIELNEYEFLESGKMY